jgi:hypothetical protein
MQEFKSIPADSNLFPIPESQLISDSGAFGLLTGNYSLFVTNVLAADPPAPAFFDKPKQKYNNPNEAKEPTKEIHNATSTEEVDTITDEELIKVLDNIKPSRWDNWNDWFNIYCIFVNEEYSWNIFDRYSRKSSKYNEHDNKRILSRVRRRDKGGLTTKIII